MVSRNQTVSFEFVTAACTSSHWMWTLHDKRAMIDKMNRNNQTSLQHWSHMLFWPKWFTLNTYLFNRQIRRSDFCKTPWLLFFNTFDGKLCVINQLLLPIRIYYPILNRYYIMFMPGKNTIISRDYAWWNASWLQECSPHEPTNAGICSCYMHLKFCLAIVSSG